MKAEKLTRELGGSWRGLSGSAPCPICQPEGRREQNALSLRDGDSGMLLYCFKSGCAFADIAAAVDLPRQSGEVDIIAQREAKKRRDDFDAKKLASARAAWNQAKPIAGTKGESYLRSRGITIPLPDSLRFLPDAYH